MEERYAWRVGSRFAGDAQEIGEELARIAAVADLTPEQVVVQAKAKRSVLHPLIYDGTTPDEALSHYQRQRASQLLKAVVVIREVENEDEIRVPAFHRIVEDEGGRSWRTLADVTEHPEWSAQVDRRLRREMASLRRELEAFNVYHEVSAALAEVLAA